MHSSVHLSSNFNSALLSRHDFQEPLVGIHLGADLPRTSALFLSSVVLMPQMVGDVGDLMPPAYSNESSGRWNFKFYM